MTTREKGTGLGLAIVAKIIEQHGGNGRTDRCRARSQRPGRRLLHLHAAAQQPPAKQTSVGDVRTVRAADRAAGRSECRPEIEQRSRTLQAVDEQVMALDILIIDDEDDIRDLIAGILEDEGYETRQAHDADSALNEIARRRPSLVFLDIWMQGSRLDGLQLLDVFQSQHPDMPVVMISGHGNVETAVSAIRRGAYDYIEKPFKIDRLLLITQRADGGDAAQDRGRRAARSARHARPPTWSAPRRRCSRCEGVIEKSAPTNSRIFISGPSGAGKGLVARLIHQRSPRAEAPFVEINCSLYSPDEVQVVLFGRETREKTGMLRTEVGALERAHGGTLYLTEVATLPRRGAGGAAAHAGREQVQPRRRHGGGADRRPHHLVELAERRGADRDRRSSAPTCSTGSRSCRCS